MILALILCATGIGLIIGIPAALYSLHLMSKADGFWQCKQCGSEFPRKLGWLELG